MDMRGVTCEHVSMFFHRPCKYFLRIKNRLCSRAPIGQCLPAAFEPLVTETVISGALSTWPSRTKDKTMVVSFHFRDFWKLIELC